MEHTSIIKFNKDPKIRLSKFHMSQNNNDSAIIHNVSIAGKGSNSII